MMRFPRGRQKEDGDQFFLRLRRKQERMLSSKKQRKFSPWFGLGMFGMIGWSVAGPAALGVLLGHWIDTRWRSHYSWTIMLLFAGVFMGVFMAIRWMHQESQKSEEK